MTAPCLTSIFLAYVCHITPLRCMPYIGRMRKLPESGYRVGSWGHTRLAGRGWAHYGLTNGLQWRQPAWRARGSR